MKKEQKRRNGFTLIEILVVIAVIAVLAAMVAPNVFGHVSSAKSAAAQSQIEMLSAALDAYRLDTGKYPRTDEGLAALMNAPAQTANWRGPYLRKSVPLDPWQNAYVYLSPGEQSNSGFDLLSYGADGQAGGDGEASDVTSW